MCIETLEPNLPQFTLLKSDRGDLQILTHNKRPILTTDQDALIAYAATRVQMNPTATYCIKRLNSVMEM